MKLLPTGPTPPRTPRPRPHYPASRAVTYNPDGLPSRIVHDTGSSPLATDFAYDGDGFRVKKVAGNRFTLYAGDNFEKNETGASKFLFANGSRLAKIHSSAGTFFFHQDHLGSTTVVSDASGNAVAGESAEYKPFGGFRAGLDSMVSNYRFTDQEFDPESNLYYYDARYYDPIIGRFVSADTVIPDYTDPQSLNRYSYVKNNPLIYSDPDGHVPFLAAGLGFLFGVAFDYYDQWQQSNMAFNQYRQSGDYTVQRAAREGGWGSLSAVTGAGIASTSWKVGAKALTSGTIEAGYEWAKKEVENQECTKVDLAAAVLGGYFSQHFSELTEKTVKAFTPRFTSKITNVSFTNNYTWRGRTPVVTGARQESWRYQVGVSTGTLIEEHLKNYADDKIKLMKNH